MIVGIDGNEANVATRVGIGEYAFELLKQFKEFSPLLLQCRTAKQNFEEQANIRFQVYLKEPPREDMPKEGENWKYIVVKPAKLWTQIGLPLYLFTHFPRPTVFFSPSHYSPRFSPVRTVISIMDLSYIHFPHLFAKKDLYQLVNWTKYSAESASKVFTISNSSRSDIIKYYHKNPADVIVTYPGIKEESIKYQLLSMDELKQKFGINGEYILFVGTLQPRKNIVRLIQAFAKILRDKDTKILSEKEKKSPNISISQYPNLQLVVVGKKGWLYEDILEEPEKLGIKDRVKFMDFVDNEDLPSLYKYATCYVLPSLYEGFGLPVVEAMRYGSPVITSNVSSLPEAGGDAAIYVDPENVEDIAEKIEKVVGDKKLQEQMRKKGYEQVKKFSWEKAAAQTLEVLEEVGRRAYER